MGIYTNLASIIIFLLLRALEAQGQEILFWCGSTYEDASTSCVQSCPEGYGCLNGLICYAGVTSCSSTTNVGSDSSASDSSSLTFIATPTMTSSSVDSSTTSPPSLTSNTDTLLVNASIEGLTGVAAIEATFQAMKDVIDNELFLYETPAMQWEPSSVYRFDGFFSGMQVMHSEGVAGKTLYMGGDCGHCHMYGLINVAAFLAQAMKETIRYDACDENSWDRVGDQLMYPISNSCGQLGQSYQDYHCSEEEKHMECEVDPNMTITAVTHAKWWGAPGPLMCGPKSLIPQTGYWDYNYACDNPWASPPETCDAYEGQKGGKAINDVAYPNAAGRTDVEGCCWWGRGVIQTSGICNFGKLNYFLGKRAADEGRESRYPDVDFCKDPETICWSQEHSELKWIAGFFYWINEVQEYDEGGWNYFNELRKFVDDGMVDVAFINSVSGIVNRGCHNPPCGTGDLDGGPERAENFMKVVEAMNFAFVEVADSTPAPETNAPTIPKFISDTLYPISTSPSLSTPSTLSPKTSSPLAFQTSPPSLGPTFPSFLSDTFLPTPLPTFNQYHLSTATSTPELDVSTLAPSIESEVLTSVPSTVGLTQPPTGSNVLPSLDDNPDMQDQEETFLSDAEVSGPDEIRYNCGNGYQVNQSDTSIPVSTEVLFDYEIYNGIDLPISEALRDVKMSILQDIAELIQCDIAYTGRRLQYGFENIVGLWSSSYDLPDPAVSGCFIDIDTSNPTTTCTPVSGSITFFSKSGTTPAAMQDTSKSIVAFIQTSMDSGKYETNIVQKVIFIDDREKASRSPILSEMSIQKEVESNSNKALLIAIYVLSSVCMLLICLVCTILRYRGKNDNNRVGRGSEIYHFRSSMPQRDFLDPESQRSSGPYTWQQRQTNWQKQQIQRNVHPQHTSMSNQNSNKLFQHPAPIFSGNSNATWDSPLQENDCGRISFGGEQTTIPSTRVVQRNNSDISSSSSDSSDSSTDSSEEDKGNETEQVNNHESSNILENALNDKFQSLHSFGSNHDSAVLLNNSAKSLLSTSSNAREERQERLARARARSATRQLGKKEIEMS